MQPKANLFFWVAVAGIALGSVAIVNSFDKGRKLLATDSRTRT